MVQQFSDQLAHIADTLPLAKIDVELYQTEGMRRELAGLYQHILLFLRHATKWYGASSAKRAFTALSVSSEKKFQETLENIKTCATKIDKMAAVGNRVDVRRIGTMVVSGFGGTEALLHQQERMLQETKAEVRQLAHQMADMRASVESLRYAFGAGGETLHAQRLLINTHNSMGRASWTEVNLRQILPALELAANPEGALSQHRSLARQTSPWRRPNRDDNDLYRDLRAWVNGDTTSVLVLQAMPLAQKRIRQIITTAIAALQQQGQAAIWYLSDTGAEKDGCSSVEGVRVVLQTLIAQVIRLLPETLCVNHTDSNSLRPSGPHSEEELLTLLVLILRRIGTCFVVIEAEDVARRAGGHEMLSRLFGSLSSRLTDSTAPVKLLFVSYQPFPSGSTPHLRLRSIGQDAPVPPKLRRPGGTAAFLGNLQKAVRR
ncbi:hypothetical protein F5X68DRAFT_252609 [Plectosphaerella plurivora]|uniref:DUF7708 domain-containing protein n=1 Tax=Plectosphaerella plurivora TaxID=936078 RepID=A0A9P8VI45_9PEZI|nr:hypothetical protein F5X68DRAFT_252609 [Plectosphaerella plurivora]